MERNENQQNRIDDSVESVLAELDEYNTYYGNVAVIFRIISFILFASLLLFVITSSFIAADEFSYSNLEYITRNYALILQEKKDTTRYPIKYNPDPVNQFELFGSGLAVCGSSSLSLYSASGRQTCSEYVNYRNPVMISSGKYVLIYDDGTGDYTVYNSFTRLYSDSLNKPIRSAVLSDNGYYALVSSSDEFTSNVEVYNADFSLISRYNKNGYVTCVDISEEKIMIVSADSDIGTLNFNVEILVSDIDNPNDTESVQQNSGFPLGCAVTPDGYTVVFSDSVLFMDQKLNVTGSYGWAEAGLYDFVIDDTNVLLVFKALTFGVSFNLICIDDSGKELYGKQITETVFDVTLNDEISYVLTEAKLYCFGEDLFKLIEIGAAGYGCRLLPINENELYYCSDTSAKLIVIDK